MFVAGHQSSFHQNGLGQALGSHLTAGVGPAGAYSRSTTDYRNPSTSPPTLAQQPVAAGHAAAGPSSHSPLVFTTVQAAAASGGPSPAAKRKQIDSSMNTQMSKRRRSENNNNGADDGDNNFDMDGGAQGAKHWTDEEKSKLFSWLMGPGQEEHWNALRATKNSCLREVSSLSQTNDPSVFDLIQSRWGGVPSIVCHTGFWREKDISGLEGLL